MIGWKGRRSGELTAEEVPVPFPFALDVPLDASVLAAEADACEVEAAAVAEETGALAKVGCDETNEVADVVLPAIDPPMSSKLGARPIASPALAPVPLLVLVPPPPVGAASEEKAEEAGGEDEAVEAVDECAAPPPLLLLPVVPAECVLTAGAKGEGGVAPGPVPAPPPELGRELAPEAEADASIGAGASADASLPAATGPVATGVIWYSSGAVDVEEPEALDALGSIGAPAVPTGERGWE